MRKSRGSVFRKICNSNSISFRGCCSKIDKEIRKLVDSYNKAKEILTEKIDDLHKIAKALITYETLTGEEIENINKNIYPKDKSLENQSMRTMKLCLGNGLKTKNSSLNL